MTDIMDFGEFVLCDSNGIVTGCDTNRVIAEFLEVDEGESFAEIYNKQLLNRGDTQINTWVFHAESWPEKF
jgi:hypothetical protein